MEEIKTEEEQKRLEEKRNEEYFTRARDLNNRLISGVFIGIFLLFFLSFLIISDRSFTWSIFNGEEANRVVKLVFEIIAITSLIPIIALAGKEYGNTFFYNHQRITPLIIFLLLINVLSPTLVYVSLNSGYFLYDVMYGIKTFTIVLLFNITFTFFTTIFIYVYQNRLKIKNLFFSFVTYLFILFFFIGILYSSFNRSFVTVIILLFISFFSDSLAYFGGKKFGKRKLAPKLSPKKTIEGFLFGVFLTFFLILAILIGVSYSPYNLTRGCLFNLTNSLFGTYYRPGGLPLYSLNRSGVYFVSMMIVLFSLILLSAAGDLFFSYIKRMYQIKDFSNLIKGHGGLLDRIDSHCFVFSLFTISSMIVSLSTNVANYFPFMPIAVV
ncbi:phosphatidate cytidylyltransferase [Ureaplasma canigenitalium]|uniref:phosphatidate cytidylyltransferase n=1 Tax=Ureaplasma canigenitalium TaxID=42092 RepID=UPI0004E24F49|nr:phosphatidate cytidylyltransferase [Ureaplasma canigenitalium]